MKRVNLVFTDMCNWNCEYCCEHTKSENIDYDYMLEMFEYIVSTYDKSISMYSFTGGELGLLKSKKFWDGISEIIIKSNIQNKVDIFTNGLLFNDFGINFLKNSKSINWHVVPSLKHNIVKPGIDISEFNVGQLIIYENNVEELRNFLDNNYLKVIDGLEVIFNHQISYKDRDYKTLNTFIKEFNSKHQKKIRTNKINFLNFMPKRKVKCMQTCPNIRLNLDIKTITPCCKIRFSNIPLNTFYIDQFMNNNICAYSYHCVYCKECFQ